VGTDEDEDTRQAAVEDDTWRCPVCNCGPEGCGDDDTVKKDCEARSLGCLGFVCECDNEGTETHGTPEEPCPAANCYHCGWGGTFPKKAKAKKKKVVTKKVKARRKKLRLRVKELEKTVASLLKRITVLEKKKKRK
jgi:hypothetical protein